ncbi:MAG: hypothetical protein NZM26_01705 [Patescibacteria group bacterium]|nr:hypothetical protein [Patescibacteria group bacterium]
MKLTIDTSKRDEFILSFGNAVLKQKSLQGSSSALLPAIKDLLAKSKANLRDISEVVVFTSGESYTGLRVGVSIAQALAFLLDVPINGEKMSKIKYITIKY